MPPCFRARWAIALILACSLSAQAHETDQFTLPPGREFADLGPIVTQWAYRAIEGGVNRTNSKIGNAIRGGHSQSVLEALQTPDEIAAAVNAGFPPALFSIENWDHRVLSADARANFPGHVVGYKPFIGVRKHAEFVLDPFRAWNCATIKVYGVYLGTDKLGHFTDMGRHYYRRYRSALRQGKSEEEATRDAVNLGSNGPLFFSERGFLGEGTAGAYSNADLASNYMGMMFYRNLTDPVMLQGAIQPPMLERDGPFWRIAYHVRPDSHFFGMFVSDHFDEALNPSRYIPKIRSKIRKAIREHASDVLNRYTDAHGNRRSREHFQQKHEELRTYWGVDYGHAGTDDDLLTIVNTCFPTMPTKAGINDRDALGMKFIHHAAKQGHLGAIEELVERGVSVDSRVRSKERHSPEWGSTPLHYAVRDGQLEAAKLLIDLGADVNAANHRGVTPLHRAIANPEMVRMLLSAGAVVNVADQTGQTPLHWAALDGSPDAMALLVDAKAAMAARDNRGRTPLHVAAAYNPGAAKFLLAAGADVDAADRLGLTPLHLAARGGLESVVIALTDAGANLNANDDIGYTALHEATRHNAPIVIARLLEAGADASLTDAYGSTPLHLASRFGRQPIARLLLGAGADAHAESRSLGTPLNIARREGHQKIAMMLLEAQPAPTPQLGADGG